MMLALGAGKDDVGTCITCEDAVHQEHLYLGSIPPWHWEQSAAIRLHLYTSTEEKREL